MATESDLTRRLCDELLRRGCVVLACVGSRMQAPGWPDRWVCLPRGFGWSGWVEAKTEHGRLSAKQRGIIRSIRDRGGNAVVLRHGTNTLEDHAGTVLATFDGTGGDLMCVLSSLAPRSPTTTG